MNEKGSDKYTELAGRLGYAQSDRFRRILEFLMTPEQAAIVAELPKPAEELSAKLDFEVSTIKRHLESLFRRGVIIPRNFETMEGAKFVREPMQLHDSTMSPLRYDPVRHGTLFQLWNEFCEAEFDRDNAANWMKLDEPMMRIVPAYKSVMDSPEILPSEDVRELVRANWPLAVVACTCRQQKESAGKKCKVSHAAVCVQLGRSAEYAITRGSGTKLSLDDALAIVDEVEEDGAVHMWLNNDSPKFAVLCNCCWDCCAILSPILRYRVPPTKMYAKSRYEARVVPDECVGCGLCVERCPFNAITLADKDSSATVDVDKCMGCGVCSVGCDANAMRMELVRPKDHIPPAPQRKAS